MAVDEPRRTVTTTSGRSFRMGYAEEGGFDVFEGDRKVGRAEVIEGLVFNDFAGPDADARWAATAWYEKVLKNRPSP